MRASPTTGIERSQSFIPHLPEPPIFPVRRLDLLRALEELSRLTADDQVEGKIQIAAKEFGENVLSLSPSERLALPKKLDEHANACLTALADTYIPDFIRTAASDNIVRTLHLGSERPFGSSSHLLWEPYTVPSDSAGWLYAVVSVVEHMPVSVAVCDMQIAGLPMVYVNQEFCRITGYSKFEAQGKNCRFLQGPQTQLHAVSLILDSIRKGRDSVTRITNYKRSGEKCAATHTSWSIRLRLQSLLRCHGRTWAALRFSRYSSGSDHGSIPSRFVARFDSVLSVRAVHNSAGVYRYCVGVQLESDARPRCVRSTMAFLQLMPDVCGLGEEENVPLVSRSLSSGSFKQAKSEGRKQEWFSNKRLDRGEYDQMFDAAFSSVGNRLASGTGAPDLRGAVRFWNGHLNMLKALDAYDSTTVFTRLQWLIVAESAFTALMPSATFRDAFGLFVHEKHSALSTQWTCSLELSAAESEGGADRSDQLREIYEKLTGESPKGKALHVLVEMMEKIVKPLNEVWSPSPCCPLPSGPLPCCPSPCCPSPCCPSPCGPSLCRSPPSSSIIFQRSSAPAYST